MTKIKLCVLSRSCDMEAVNELKPEFIGFVFAPGSKRYVTPEKAKELRKLLDPEIQVVGVFVNEEPEKIAGFLNNGIIDIAQLHGREDENYIKLLKTMTDRLIIKACQMETEKDAELAEHSLADYVLLDSSAGTGTVFDWNFIQNMKRPYFLAGGLSTENVEAAVNMLHPFAVDVSSGIETDGAKDKTKMTAFVSAVRKEDRL